MKIFLFACLLMLGTMVKAQNGYQVGDVVGDFSLKNVNGSKVTLADYKDSKGFIVVFTCNTCPVAQAYQDRIEELNQRYATKGYPVIAINTNDPVQSPGDSYEKMQTYAKAENFSYAYLEDPDHIYTKKYGATKTPTTFVLQKTDKGNTVAYIGAIDNNQQQSGSETTSYVANAIDALLQGKKPSVTNVKAIGCGVKWKKEGAE
jgi:peroxiredoxin